MDLEGNPGGRDDDLLDGVYIGEHPLIVEVVWACISKEHSVESVHKVVTAVCAMCVHCVCEGGRRGEGGEGAMNMRSRGSCKPLSYIFPAINIAALMVVYTTQY